MSTALACVGFASDDLAGLEKLLDETIPEVVGQVQDTDIVHFADRSGARVVVSVRGGDTVDLTPSFAAPTGARLANLVRVGGHAVADVVDERGGVLTRLACDLEQIQHLRDGDETVTGPLDASVVAHGVRVSVHADAAAFAVSDDSLLGDPEPGIEPLRLATESFLAYGLNADAGADPVAFVSGVVVSCATHENYASEQLFHVAQVRTVGFTATVCLAAEDHPVAPVPGNVIAGACYVVVDVATLWRLITNAPRRKRRWFGR